MSDTNKIFHLEFEDESAAATGRRHDKITYECSPDEDERLRIELIDGTPFIFGNPAGLVTLAKILVKMGTGQYKDGFHIHLHQDFNADAPEVLGLGISNSLS